MGNIYFKIIRYHNQVEGWQCRMYTAMYRAVSLRLAAGWRTFIVIIGVRRLLAYAGEVCVVSIYHPSTFVSLSNGSKYLSLYSL